MTSLFFTVSRNNELFRVSGSISELSKKANWLGDRKLVAETRRGSSCVPICLYLTVLTSCLTVASGHLAQI